MGRHVVPCGGGDTVKATLIIDGPLWWRRDDTDVWHKMEIKEDAQNPGLYGLAETATAANVP